MRTRGFTMYAAAACAVMLTATARGGTIWNFELQPSGGTIVGEAGSTTGWGYRIINPDPTDWLMLTGLNADPFQHATVESLFDFPILGPGATVQVPFDGTNGLYKLTWNASAPMGYTNTGTFTLSADWYTGDPLGTGALIGAASAHTADYTAISGVPEPASYTYVLIAALLAVFHRCLLARLTGETSRELSLLKRV